MYRDPSEQVRRRPSRASRQLPEGERDEADGDLLRLAPLLGRTVHAYADVLARAVDLERLVQVGLAADLLVVDAHDHVADLDPAVFRLVQPHQAGARSRAV